MVRNSSRIQGVRCSDLCYRPRLSPGRYKKFQGSLLALPGYDIKNLKLNKLFLVKKKKKL